MPAGDRPDVQASEASLEELFLSQLPLVDRVVAWVAARHGLRGADAEDFGSAVKTHLVAGEYEVLARFEGRSSLKTYLTVVVNRLYLDFQARRFGKWRPSAEARRLGPQAVCLERLLSRDGLAFDEACGVLLSDTRLGATRDGLEALRLRLPERPVRGRPVPAGEPVEPETGSVGVERAERQALAERTFASIRRSLGRLPARDRVFLRLHLESGLTVAEAARVLRLEQKALYRRQEEILRRLRADLEADGVGRPDARELLTTLDWDATLGRGEAEGGPPAEKAPLPSVSQAGEGRPGRGTSRDHAADGND